MERLTALHLTLAQTSKLDSKNKLFWFKHNGWGFKDTQFVLRPDGAIMLTGNRYQFAGQKLPKFKEWAENQIGININKPQPDPQTSMKTDEPVINQAFANEVQTFIQIVFEPQCRILHSHGHTLQQIFALRQGKFERIVDGVVYLTSHQQAQKLVAKANQHNVVLVPYGGGTNVTQALAQVKEQTRMIISVDMSKLNRVKWVDKKSMTACVQAGIIGRDLQKQLNKQGVMCGHQPDSVEFSSLGGWISTRASGMKKNKYGNIDDILLNVKIVTPVGTLSRCQNAPRVSSGPDINQLILGHQGNFGIITQAVLKIRPTPQIQIYDSIIFHDFDLGSQFMYQVAQSKLWPASIRTVDNNQFRFGMALKTQSKDKLHQLADKAKKYFVTDVMKFQPQKMCLTTIVYEGSKDQVSMQQKTINAIAKKFKGFRAGAQNGQRGYFLTFVIAYLRDFGLKYGFIAESFQTSVPWTGVKKLCINVRKCIQSQCKKYGVRRDPFVSFRVTQVYDSGAAVYVYFGFLYGGLKDPVEVYTEVEDAARQEILRCGGSISHHHGIGKLRKKFMQQSVGKTGLLALQGLKKTFDPNNIMGCRNLI